MSANCAMGSQGSILQVAHLGVQTWQGSTPGQIWKSDAITCVIHVRDVSKDNKDPSLKAKARTKDLRLKAKARTKAWTFKAKARTKDSTFKARTKDSRFVLKDNQGPRPRTTSLVETVNL